MAAQSGEMIFVGRSGQRYVKNVYFDDTANNLVRFDAGTGAGAATPDHWIPPEQVVLTDLILAAATGQTKTQIVRGDSPTGDMLLNALHLVTVVFRPRLAVVYPAGSKITAIQLA